MARPDYGRATWYGAYSGNYMAANRPGSNRINKVIIHVVQGSWSSALNWFKDSRAGVSAHYTVRSSDGRIGQSVEEKNIAYHAGYWSYNQTSIGIEHEGYISNSSWFTDEMYRSSARLTAYLCKKYKIPIDRQHIIGHHEVPGCSGGGGGVGCHTDPGPYWNWSKYMRLVREYAGTSTASSTYKQVVDNASPRFRASGAWKVSSYSAQKVGKNYRYTRPANVNDAARFKVRIPARGNYAVYAWWPANSGYNNRTRFRIRTTSGWKTKVVNQRRNGGKWVLLGVYNMPAGDKPYIRIPRRSNGSGYIIADAIAVIRV